MFKNMIKRFFVIWIFLAAALYGQTQPGQPASGYGGSDYKYGGVNEVEQGEDESAYFIFMPDNPQPDSANVVVFNHGYGAVNPAIYGAWIKHLVRKGNIVIYPRYQKNLRTSPAEYTPNSAAAVLKAFELLKSNSSYVKPKNNGYVIIGHSYGGVITANEAYNYEELNLPKPKAIMSCAPGTKGFDKGRYESYNNMPNDIPILIISESEDEIVGDEFPKELYESISSTPESIKAWYEHQADKHGKNEITAGHNCCLASDKEFDTKEGRRRVKKSIEDNVPNSVDYYVYWRLADALIDAAFNTGDYSKVFGKGAEQTYAGEWSDGTPIAPLKVK